MEVGPVTDFHFRLMFFFILRGELLHLCMIEEPELLRPDERMKDRQASRDRILKQCVILQADAASFQHTDRFFERAEDLRQFQKRLSFDDASIHRIEDGIFQTIGQEHRFQLFVGLDVGDFFLLRDAEERRLSDVDESAFDQIVHLTVEERQKQRADVRAILPVAICEPCELCGTTVKRANLANVACIEALGLEIGHEVIITKAGCIIPKILKDNVTGKFAEGYAC